MRNASPDSCGRTGRSILSEAAAPRGVNSYENTPNSEWKRRIGKFGELYKDLSGYVIPAPLIAQLSKNDNAQISGNELIRLALDKIAELQRNFSGKIVYLECSDEQKLIDFYERNGFRKITSERAGLKGEPLVQMICYLHE